MNKKKYFIHFRIITYWIVVFSLLAGGCNRSKPVNEAERFDRIARKVFKDVYPGLARQILDDYGIIEGVCLDIGCGPAYLAIELARRSGLRVIGVDIDSQAVRIGQRNLRLAGLQSRVEIEWGDVHALRFGDGAADLVVSRGSFLFWRDRVVAFREIERVLKPGGVAFVGGGMGRSITSEQRESIKKQLDEQKINRPSVTRFEVEEALDLAGIPSYRIVGDGPADAGCKCGMWVEIRKVKPKVSSKAGT